MDRNRSTVPKPEHGPDLNPHPPNPQRSGPLFSINSLSKVCTQRSHLRQRTQTATAIRTTSAQATAMSSGVIWNSNGKPTAPVIQV